MNIVGLKAFFNPKSPWRVFEVLYIGNAIPKISAPRDMDLRKAPFLRFSTNKTVFGITAAPMTSNHLLTKGTKKTLRSVKAVCKISSEDFRNSR